ncbi:DUF3426 domain-containing protein [Variovorax sp. RA8]|uniref:DUF3426 domain-containing protein n=1 Tax=Variovorax sp. (strain JCM 16519 / RA8) TaxID=662548 RepID=UPI001317BE69|nr:DUF3426 domain-containing protein [Variovorax sp. RA8]VTU15852.1 family finger-like domain protein [Variovorax sp. RA8]
MSLVTRCPACGTTFKVVRDQLRISEGWVRCGRCSEVFDATLDLHEAPDPAPASKVPAPLDDTAASAPPPAAAPAPALPAQEEAEPPGEELGRHVEETDFLDDEHETEPPLAGPPVADAPASEAPGKPEAPVQKSGPQSFTGVVADEPWEMAAPMVEADPHVVPPYPSFPPFPNIDLNLPAQPPIGREARPAEPAPPEAKAVRANAAEEDAANVQLQKALRRARAKSAKIARAKARGEERAARESAPVVLAASEPGPVLDNPRRLPRFAAAAAGGAAFWQRTGARRALVGVALFAAVLLVVQVLHQERDLIAARQPSLRPALAALCGLTGCELSAPKQIGDITIDGASFAREKSGDAYRLNFTLRNGAPLPLAMPAIELSLLDTQERAVVRRVLMPAEFGAPSVLPARAERAASLPLVLTGPEAAGLPPVAGFHLLAFYP